LYTAEKANMQSLCAAALDKPKSLSCIVCEI